MKTIETFFSLLLLLICLGIQSLYLMTPPVTRLLFLNPLPFLLISLVLALNLSPTLKRITNLYRWSLLLLGPFASLGFLILIFFRPKRALAQQYREFVSAEAVFTTPEKMELGLDQWNWETEETSITPYVDIMEGEDTLLKRNTINKIIQHPGANSRIILDIGLTDPDPDIRFYAASALILLNDSFVKEFREINQKVIQEPENPLFHYELASAYDRYCTWNLPEKEDLVNYYKKIEQSYQKSLQLNPRSLNTTIGLVRILIKQKHYQKASEIMKTGLEVFPNSAILTFHHLILLFQSKKYEELKQEAILYLKRFPQVSLEIREAVMFWVSLKNH